MINNQLPTVSHWHAVNRCNIYQSVSNFQRHPVDPNGICSQYLMESKHVSLSPSLPHIIQLMVILPGSAKLDFLWLISTISILIVISSWTTGWVSGWSWISVFLGLIYIYINTLQYIISLCLTILYIYIHIYIYIPYFASMQMPLILFPETSCAALDIIFSRSSSFWPCPAWRWSKAWASASKCKKRLSQIWIMWVNNNKQVVSII